MFAVLKTGGKQYKVASGDVLKVEKLAGSAGDKVQFNDVLMLGGDAVVVVGDGGEAVLLGAFAANGDDVGGSSKKITQSFR